MPNVITTQTRTAADCLKEIAHFASQHRQAKYRLDDAPPRARIIAENNVDAYAALIADTVSELVSLPADETAAALVDHFTRNS